MAARKWHKNPAPHRSLKHGDRGADVKQFQRGLNKRAAQRGWKTRVKPDGVAGRPTFALWRKVRFEIGLPEGLKPTKTAQLNVRQPWTRSRVAKRRAEQRRPQRPVAGQLTPNFHISEFACKDGTPVPSYMEPHLRGLCERCLEPQRARFGPAAVNSGYRPAAYNARIGGEDGSFHVYELRRSQPAADTFYSKGTPAEWGANAKRLLWNSGDGGGVGIYPSQNFVHQDTRTYRSEWWG